MGCRDMRLMPPRGRPKDWQDERPPLNRDASTNPFTSSCTAAPPCLGDVHARPPRDTSTADARLPLARIGARVSIDWSPERVIGADGVKPWAHPRDESTPRPHRGHVTIELFSSWSLTMNARSGRSSLSRVKAGPPARRHCRRRRDNMHSNRSLYLEGPVR